MTETPHFFSISGVAKSFHYKRILKNISFQLDHGEKVVLIGPNGVGKTTLLKILAGIMRPDNGSGTLENLPMFKEDPNYRKNLIFWGHQSLFYPAFNAVENLDFFLRLRRDSVPREKILAGLEKFDLHQYAAEPVRVYSAGMLQRLTLLKLSMSSWKLGLMDEPTSALDVSGLKVLDDLMNSWTNDGRTILFSTHDFEWACRQADRVVGISDGEVRLDQQDPAPEDLLGFLETGS